MGNYDNSNAQEWSFGTRSIHAGQQVDQDYGARNQPIYMTTSYVFDDAQHAENRFNLSDAGPIYTRLTNPTQSALEDLSLIHISEPTRRTERSRMPSSA